MHAKIEELTKIKVGAVNYLNTRPLLYGIERSIALQEQIILIRDYPAHIASLLLSNMIDVGLAPVAIIPKLIESHIITDYCIGANGPVASVCIYSAKPFEAIDTILLDYQSRTSVNLCKVLLRHFWKKEINLVNTTTEFSHRIASNTAGLLIGDRALAFNSKPLYKYDLAEIWKNMTGLPFVFAVWVSNKQLPESFISLFNKENKTGLDNMDVVITEQGDTPFDLHQYYKKNISYNLDEQKIKGLHLFLELMKENE